MKKKKRFHRKSMKDIIILFSFIHEQLLIQNYVFWKTFLYNVWMLYVTHVHIHVFFKDIFFYFLRWSLFSANKNKGFSEKNYSKVEFYSKNVQTHNFHMGYTRNDRSPSEPSVSAVRRLARKSDLRHPKDVELRYSILGAKNPCCTWLPTAEGSAPQLVAHFQNSSPGMTKMMSATFFLYNLFKYLYITIVRTFDVIKRNHLRFFSTKSKLFEKSKLGLVTIPWQFSKRTARYSQSNRRAIPFTNASIVYSLWIRVRKKTFLFRLISLIWRTASHESIRTVSDRNCRGKGTNTFVTYCTPSHSQKSII